MLIRSVHVLPWCRLFFCVCLIRCDCKLLKSNLRIEDRLWRQKQLSYSGINRIVNAIPSCLDLWKGSPVIQTTFQILLACRESVICSLFSGERREAQSERGAGDTRDGGRSTKKCWKLLSRFSAPGSPQKRENITPLQQTKFIFPTVTKALSTQTRGGNFKTKYHVSAFLTHETREAASFNP